MERIFSMWIMVAVICVVLFLPVQALAQGTGEISVVILDPQTFVTVKTSLAGDTISLYRVQGDRIVLVESVVNTSKRAASLPNRYLHRLEVENR